MLEPRLYDIRDGGAARASASVRLIESVAMSDPQLSDDPLTGLLAEVHAGRRPQAEFLQLLLRSRICLLMSAPWDGRSIPEADVRVLMVSDPSTGTVEHIAVFSSRARAEAFQPNAPGFQPVEVDAFMAFLGLRDGQGLIVNPRHQHGFRLPPKAAVQVRDAAYKVLQGMKPSPPAAKS